MLQLAISAAAAAPQVLHTPGYESPVRGDPDDLLMIAGTGFHPTDRVVYQAMDVAPTRPRIVPATSTVEAGIAPVVQHDNPPYALTVRLPSEMQKGRAYRLWVVTAKNEWSEALSINDPRPQWVTPGYVYSTVDLAGLGRVIRVVGRNLAGVAGHRLKIRLRGTDQSSYMLTTQVPTNDSEAVQSYVATAALPARLSPGLYSISVRRDSLDWVELADQKLEVRPDPPTLPTYPVDDPVYGGCHPDDAADDSSCFARAIEAAGRAGGGIVQIPPGHWDVTTGTRDIDGFVLPRNVHLRGAGADISFIWRHGPVSGRRPNALFTLTGHNSVANLTFSDEWRFHSLPESRPVIQLGTMPVSDESKSGVSHLVEDIVISDNAFLHVGRGITDEAGRPIARLFIVRNRFGGYSHGIDMPGNRVLTWEPFGIEDSVVRGNRFVPGSYVDLSIKQGVMASGMGAAHRVDFSANVADGTTAENLQDPDDPPGFRAGFFWNTNNSVERLLISQNQISCSGDKVGDGEAIAFDDSGNTVGFQGTVTITAAGPDWITVRGKLLSEQVHTPIPANYYSNGHWVQVAAGRGIGQTRKITAYTQDATTSTVTFHVAPAWDIVPGGSDSRIFVARHTWQVEVVDNDIEQRRPPCHKSNPAGPYGGAIVIWTTATDLSVEANQQWDTDGILFMHTYDAPTPSCLTCANRLFFHTGLEIRGNRVDGEYDWSSDCSEAGIRSTFGAPPTPESPPPVQGLGVSISHNIVSHSDGLRGGGIDIAVAAFTGPPPGNWPFIENLLVFHNELRDMEGPLPSSPCHRGQGERSGIRLEGHDNVRDSVLYDNRCERIAKPLSDAGLRTLKICPTGSQGSCECGDGS